MEKRKKGKIKVLGFKLKDLIQLGTILGAFFLGWRHFENKFHAIDHRFDTIDRRFESIDRRFESVENRLDRIEGDLKQTSDLLNVYLTWRFLYVNDPTRKNLRPRYDPNTQTLELVDKNNRAVK